MGKVADESDFNRGQNLMVQEIRMNTLKTALLMVIFHADFVSIYQGCHSENYKRGNYA